MHAPRSIYLNERRCDFPTYVHTGTVEFPGHFNSGNIRGTVVFLEEFFKDKNSWARELEKIRKTNFRFFRLFQGIFIRIEKMILPCLWFACSFFLWQCDPRTIRLRCPVLGSVCSTSRKRTDKNFRRDPRSCHGFAGFSSLRNANTCVRNEWNWILVCENIYDMQGHVKILVLTLAVEW